MKETSRTAPVLAGAAWAGLLSAAGLASAGLAAAASVGLAAVLSAGFDGAAGPAGVAFEQACTSGRLARVPMPSRVRNRRRCMSSLLIEPGRERRRCTDAS